MFFQLKTIIEKEILDAVRDIKSLSTALLMPVFFAVFTLGSMYFIVSIQKGSEEITLPVQGINYATPLIAWLEERGVKIVDAPTDPASSILNREWDAILIIPEDFNDTFRQQRPAQLDLMSDHSQNSAQAKVRHVQQLITEWSLTMGSMRLIARNISPGIANPVIVNPVNVTSDQRVAAKILASFPMFTMLIVFASGIGMASDMTAGERERKSLEPLLINPVSHSLVFTAKWSAAILVTFCIAVIGIGLQFVSISYAPIAELGIRLDIGFREFFLIVALIIPVIFLATALQLVVSFFARSFKDAQSYNSLIVMLPMVPGIYLTFNSASAETWQMWIPVMGPTALIVDVIGGDQIASIHIAIASLMSLLTAALLVGLGVTILKREKTLFN